MVGGNRRSLCNIKKLQVMNTGLQLSPIAPEDFVLGASNELGGTPLVPDGQWGGWLPDNEVQNQGIETFACVSFATLNCVEILERFEYGFRNNWSDRFLAYATGTEALKGNSPQTVAEFLRKKGTPPETDYPFVVQGFYDTPPQKLYTLALQFPAEYNLGHEYIPSNAPAMMEALKYSPLAASVYAWVKDGDGLFHRPQGMTDNHLTVIYGYEEGKYWKVFDSYFNDGVVIKKLRWDAIPMQMKRFTLHRQVVVESAWSKFLSWMREILYPILGDRTFGASRSPRWREVRARHIALNPKCAVCGTKSKVLSPNSVHHRIPFHLNPEMELDEINLITLCPPHHLLLGHLMSFKSWNKDIEMDADYLYQKIMNRP